MIDYEEDWLVRLLFLCKGSVAFRASFYAVAATFIAVGCLSLDEVSPGLREKLGIVEASSTIVWAASTGCLLLLLSFRTKQALDRFWEGSGLLHQMRGEWFDAVSCCIAFSSKSVQHKPTEALAFRHTLVRLMSLCHGSALEEIKGHGQETDMIETIDVQGLDTATLAILVECKERYKFNRVELLVHMIQMLITNAQETGVISVAPPILSRVYQTLSRGFVNQLNAKKITDTRFPFPYAQTIALLLLLSVILTPLMVSTAFSHCLWVAVFTFVPVFGSYSLNFIASELENPFGNDENDLPLANFQSEMINSLLMLLHCKTDHIPGLSPQCKIDFTSLRGTSSMNLSQDMLPSEETSSDGSQELASPRSCPRKKRTSLVSFGAPNIAPQIFGVQRKKVGATMRNGNSAESEVTKVQSLRSLVEDRDGGKQRRGSHDSGDRRGSTGSVESMFGSPQQRERNESPPCTPRLSPAGSPRTRAAPAQAGGATLGAAEMSPFASEGMLASETSAKVLDTLPPSTTSFWIPSASEKMASGPGLAGASPFTSEAAYVPKGAPKVPLLSLEARHVDIFPQEQEEAIAEPEPQPTPQVGLRSAAADHPGRISKDGDRRHVGNGSVDVSRMYEYGPLSQSIDELTRLLQDWGGKLHAQQDVLSRTTLGLQGFKAQVEQISSTRRERLPAAGTLSKLDAL